MKDVFIKYDEAKGAFKDVFEQYKRAYGLDPRKHYIRVSVDDDGTIVDAEFGKDPGAVKTAATEAGLNVIPGLVATVPALAIGGNPATALGAAALTGLRLLASFITGAGARYLQDKALAELAPDIIKTAYTGYELHRPASIIGGSVGIAPAQKFLPVRNLARALASGQGVREAAKEVLPPFLLGGAVSAGAEAGVADRPLSLGELATAFASGGLFGGGAPREIYKNLPGYKAFVPQLRTAPEGKPPPAAEQPQALDQLLSTRETPTLDQLSSTRQPTSEQLSLFPEQPLATETSTAATRPVAEPAPTAEPAPELIVLPRRATAAQLVGDIDIATKRVSDVSKPIDQVPEKADIISRAVDEGVKVSPAEVQLLAAAEAVRLGKTKEEVIGIYNNRVQELNEKVGYNKILGVGLDPWSVLKYADKLEVTLPPSLLNVLGDRSLAPLASRNPDAVLRAIEIVDDPAIGSLLSVLKFDRAKLVKTIVENPSAVIDRLKDPKTHLALAQRYGLLEKVPEPYRKNIANLIDLARVEPILDRLNIIHSLGVTKFEDALKLATDTRFPEWFKQLNGPKRDQALLEINEAIGGKLKLDKLGVLTPEGYLVSRLKEAAEQIGDNPEELLSRSGLSSKAAANTLKRISDGDTTDVGKLKALKGLEDLLKGDGSVEAKIEQGARLIKELGDLRGARQVREYYKLVDGIYKELRGRLAGTALPSSEEFIKTTDELVRTLAKALDGDLARVEDPVLRNKLVKFYANADGYKLPFDKNVYGSVNLPKDVVEDALQEKRVAASTKEEGKPKEEVKTKEESGTKKEEASAKEEVKTKEEETGVKEGEGGAEEEVPKAKKEGGTEEEAPKGKGSAKVAASKAKLKKAYEEQSEEFKQKVPLEELEELRQKLDGNADEVIKFLDAVEKYKNTGKAEKIINKYLSILPEKLREYVNSLRLVKKVPVKKAPAKKEAPPEKAPEAEEAPAEAKKAPEEEAPTEKAAKEEEAPVSKKKVSLEELFEKEEKETGEVYYSSVPKTQIVEEEFREVLKGRSLSRRDVEAIFSIRSEVPNGEKLLKAYFENPEKNVEHVLKNFLWYISSFTKFLGIDTDPPVKYLKPGAPIWKAVLRELPEAHPTFKELSLFIRFISSKFTKEDLRGLWAFIENKELPDDIKRLFKLFMETHSREARRLKEIFPKQLGGIEPDIICI